MLPTREQVIQEWKDEMKSRVSGLQGFELLELSLVTVIESEIKEYDYVTTGKSTDDGCTILTTTYKVDYKAEVLLKMKYEVLGQLRVVYLNSPIVEIKGEERSFSNKICPGEFDLPPIPDNYCSLKYGADEVWASNKTSTAISAAGEFTESYASLIASVPLFNAIMAATIGIPLAEMKNESSKIEEFIKAFDDVTTGKIDDKEFEEIKNNLSKK